MGITTKYDSLFQSASEKYGVDYNLLRAIGLTESSYNPNAVSSAGAVGIMQLMPSTAKAYGVSNSYDPAQNINGAAQLLADLSRQYNGDTSKVLAAYNTGSGTVSKYGITSAGQKYINAVSKNYSTVSSGSTVENVGWFGDWWNGVQERWDESVEDAKDVYNFFAEPLAEGSGFLWWLVKILLILVLGMLAVFFGYKALDGSSNVERVFLSKA